MSKNTNHQKCLLCGYEVESINDLRLCGHCKKTSCPNCNAPIELGIIER